MSRGRAPLHAVVLSGGAGERLWPSSRRSHPKPLLRIDGGPSLLEGTLARAHRFAPPERSWLVCVREQLRPMRAQAKLPRGHVLVEPRRRNTAMAVALAAHRIVAEDPEAVLVVLPADHHVPDARRFEQAVRRAAAAATAEEGLVTLGVRPTRPETGYGYIRLGAAAPEHPGLHRVRRFVEKPDRPRARRFLRQGDYVWNAGIFVWKARVLLDEIERHAPAVHRALAALRRFPGGRGFTAAADTAYRRAPSVSIDTAVLERSRRVWCLPVGFRWSDVGTWESLAELAGVGPGANRALRGEVLSHGAQGNLVWAEDRLVALVGVEGLAVVDTGDVLLVTRLDRSSEVREIVARLRSAGRRDLI